MSPTSNSVVVIGLGRFGGAVAESLVRLGHDVLGIDENPELVQRWSDVLTHVVQADTTNTDTLRRLGVGDFESAVVGIGDDLEGSVLTVLSLVELGVKDIWVKARSVRHGRILERTGAHHVVYPELAMGERVAHLVTGRMIDFIEFDDGFAIAKTRAPREAVGKTLAESALRSKYGITIVGVKRPRTDFTYAKPETRIESGDLLIVSGPTKLVEAFAALT
ncbi:MAG: TrkA family potassium uptake protein [Rhodospirillaceae bacterium]|nr:TrkA family potassium uptake protein [Rhodospirillaceae bacterium]